MGARLSRSGTSRRPPPLLQQAGAHGSETPPRAPKFSFLAGESADELHLFVHASGGVVALFARGPVPRTDVHREKRRELVERSRNGLHYDVDQVVIDALVHALPGLREEPASVARGFAQVYTASSMRARRHASHEGCFSLNSIELEGAFGRQRFNDLNRRYGVVELVAEWEGGSTRAYRLQSRIRDTVNAHLDAFIRTPGATTAVIRPDGKQLRRQREWNSHRNLRGLPESIVGEASLVHVVPVDMEALLRLDECLLSAAQASFSARVAMLIELGLDFNADPEYLRDVLRMVMIAARRAVSGYGNIAHEYVMCGTGRLFGKGTSLQSSPKIIKQCALPGMWEYDFSNCHFTIIKQLVGRVGMECPTVNHYLANKKAIRAQLAEAVGVEVDSIKRCLINLAYGAPRSVRPQDAIPREIGTAKARLLKDEPFVRDLDRELRKARSVIIGMHPARRGVIRNVLNLPFEKATKGELQAHILQGIEAQALFAVLRRYHKQLLLLEHDGFVATQQLDMPEVEAVVAEAVGCDLRLEVEQIRLPAVLDAGKSLPRKLPGKSVV